MRCPRCQHHVTPFFNWAFRTFKDDPQQCSWCGIRLYPSYRVAWLMPLALMAFVPALPLVVLIQGGLRPSRVVVFIVVAPIVTGIFYLGWQTGTYRAQLDPATDGPGPPGRQQREKSVALFEHGLDFQSLEDAVAYARLSLTAGYDRTGNWDLAQTCRHMTDWLRAPLDGPPPTPWFMKLPMAIIRLTHGPGLLKKFLAERRLPVGMPTVAATEHPPETDATAAVEEFAATAARFSAHTGPWLRPSPLFNKLDHEQTLALQLVHCMHHFGRLKPRSTQPGAEPNTPADRRGITAF
jgi:hypothetical protein